MAQSDSKEQMNQVGIVALSRGERVTRARRSHQPARAG
jgi:hypothetical protein